MLTQVAPTGLTLLRRIEALGYSPEQMPAAMQKAGIEFRNIPSGRTIRRAVKTGRIPHRCYARGLAEFLGFEVDELWPLEQRVMILAVAA